MSTYPGDERWAREQAEVRAGRRVTEAARRVVALLEDYDFRDQIHGLRRDVADSIEALRDALGGRE